MIGSFKNMNNYNNKNRQNNTLQEHGYHQMCGKTVENNIKKTMARNWIPKSSQEMIRRRGNICTPATHTGH